MWLSMSSRISAVVSDEIKNCLLDDLFFRQEKWINSNGKGRKPTESGIVFDILSKHYFKR